MLGSTVYEAVLDSLRKDKRGLAISLDEFNRLSPLINNRLLADYCKDFENGIDITSSIGAFKKLDQPLYLSSGKIALPSDYYQMIGEPWYTDASSVVRYLDVVTSLEHSKRERDYLTKSTLKHPTCVIGSEDSAGNLEIRVYPATITTIYVDYIRETATPFLDYYMNTSTLVTSYLTAEQGLVNISGSNVYRDGTTGNKTSLTVDWEWESDQLPLIVAYFREEIGGILPDEGMVQVGMKDKIAMG
jgi:hypothetical protein